jgi:FAD/FMN-containing dehydrogenase
VAALTCATRSGSEILLLDAAVDGLRSRVLGGVLRRGDDGYDGARVVFNAMFDRHPALIVQCAGVADVREAVRFAREHNLLVSIRGGGHGVTGNAVCESGLGHRHVADAQRRLQPSTRTAQLPRS